MVKVGSHSVLAQQVHTPFPTAHMDLRKMKESLNPGVCFVGITGPVIPLDRLRPMLAPRSRTPGVATASHERFTALPSDCLNLEERPWFSIAGASL